MNILEDLCCVDHIHTLMEIPSKVSVSGFMGYKEATSSLMFYAQFGGLEFKYRNRGYWCSGYYVNTAGKNAAKIKEYIMHQFQVDKMR